MAQAHAVFSGAAQGLSAGVTGGLAMLPVWVVFSWARGRMWWEGPNILGSTFYGERAFRSGAGMATISGTAFHLVLTGCFGILFGIACGALLLRRRTLLLGIAAGLLWYFAADQIFWRHVNPLVPIYMFPPGALIAHFVYGACLGLISRVPFAPQNGEAIAPADAVN